MRTYKMWIGGEWADADSGRTFRTYNPANGEAVAEVPLAGLPDVDKAVNAARAALPAWRKRARQSAPQQSAASLQLCVTTRTSSPSLKY